MKIIEHVTFIATLVGAIMCLAAVFMANAANAEQTWRIPPNVQCISYRVTDGRVLSPTSPCYEFIPLPEPTVVSSYAALGAGLYALTKIRGEKFHD